MPRGRRRYDGEAFDVLGDRARTWRLDASEASSPVVRPTPPASVRGLRAAIVGWALAVGPPLGVVQHPSESLGTAATLLVWLFLISRIAVASAFLTPRCGGEDRDEHARAHLTELCALHRAARTGWLTPVGSQAP